ncbi:MAG: serine hydrolase domain-containing protein [Terriglobales bacterium]
MKQLLTTACLFVVTASCIAPRVFGQGKKAAKVISSPAGSLTTKVDTLFARWNKSDSPGCALGIVKDGRLIYKRGYGMANLDYNIPISPNTIFDIGSMSKQFTAMSILLLAKQGKLSLDDEIQNYLPELPRYQSPITIRHLIHHTSGIRDYVQLFALAGRPKGYLDLADDDFLGLIVRQKGLNFKPGEEDLYSNSGYFLLGVIVKRVSGKSLSEFAEENIFKPLGMNHTHLDVDRHLVVKNRATGYYPSGKGGFSVSIETKRDELDTTVKDLFLWDQNFYNNKLGGGPDLINEELSTGMLNNGEKLEYAFGLYVGEYRGLKVIGHGGYGGGFNSAMYRYPGQRWSVICLCNAEPERADGLTSWVFTAQVADIFLADQFKKGAGGVSEAVAVAGAPAVISIPEKELAGLTGLYVDPIAERYIYFYMENGKLMVAWDTGYALSPRSQNRFKVVGWPGVEIGFERPMAGGRTQVKVIDSGKTATYETVQSETPTSVQLAEFTGTYASDELMGATYTLSIKDRRLVLDALGRKDILLTPAFGDIFFIVGLIHWYPGEPNHQLTMVRFVRDQQDAISGFTLSREPEGPRNLRFNKL